MQISKHVKLIMSQISANEGEWKLKFVVSFEAL